MQNILAEAIKASFYEWAKTHCKNQIAKIEKETFEIIEYAIDEMQAYKPGSYDVWWTVDHVKFKINGKQQRLMHEVMFHFLTDYAHGRLGKKETKKRQTNNRKKK